MTTIELTDEERGAMSDIIDGTLDSIPGNTEDMDDVDMWIAILRKLGFAEMADAWVDAFDRPR